MWNKEIEKVMGIHCNYGCDDPELALAEMKNLISKILDSCPLEYVGYDALWYNGLEPEKPTPVKVGNSQREIGYNQALYIVEKWKAKVKEELGE